MNNKSNVMKSILLYSIFAIGIFCIISCSPQQKTTKVSPDTSEEKIEEVEEIPLPDYAIPNEIIVVLNPTSDIRKIQGDFRDYDIKVLKNLAPNPPMVLITYDTTKIKPRKMLDLLQQHNGVKQAEFNKKGSGRG